jgi:hypothetical protein
VRQPRGLTSGLAIFYVVECCNQAWVLKNHVNGTSFRLRVCPAEFFFSQFG